MPAGGARPGRRSVTATFSPHHRVSRGEQAMTVRNEHLALIPAYNEAATSGAVVRSVHAKGLFPGTLVVNDGSTDDTAGRARAAGANVLELPFNLGIGGAVQAGFVFAKENGYRFMVQVDGDGQHDASEIATLQAVMNQNMSLDMVCGSRFMVPGEYLAPISRRTGIHVF